MKKRENWIDILRSLAMLIVVMVHVYSKKSIFFTLTGPIMIPLFFYISGYVFNTSKTVPQFYCGVVKRVLIPYLFFSLVPVRVVVNFFNGRSETAIQLLWDSLTGKIFWFIPCLIITESLMLIQHKLFRTEKQVLISLASVVILAFAIRDCEAMRLFCFDSSLLCLLFMNIGWFFKKYNDSISQRASVVIGGGLAIYLASVVISFVFYPGEYIDVHLNHYYNYFLNILCCGSACVGLALIFKRCTFESKSWAPVLAVGRYTLVIYLLHGHVYPAIIKLAGVIIRIDRSNFLHVLIVSILSCTVCTIVAFCVEKICPALVGTKRKM